MALPRCVVSRYTMAWAESLEGAMSGQQFWALLCCNRCRLLLTEIPRGVDRNSELKQRPHLWESGQISVLVGKVLGQQSSGPLRRTARGAPPQTDEQRGKRASALIAQGLVGGAAQGSADCRRNWTTALIPRSSGMGTHPSGAKCAEAARMCGVEGAGTERNRYRFVAHVKLSPMSAPGPTRELGRHRLLRRSWPEEAPVLGP